MPADQLSVNLLGHDALEESPIGRIVNWATTYGRYIMILTEVVVLLAFISRFSLDRKLTDLNEAIEQKQAIIEANQPFEQDILALQTQLARIKTVMKSQAAPLELLTLIKSVLPSDVYLQKLTLREDTLKLKAVAQSTSGFTVFVNNMQSVRQFTRVDMSDVKKVPAEGIVFEISAQLAAQKPVPKAAPEPAGDTAPANAQ